MTQPTQPTESLARYACQATDRDFPPLARSRAVDAIIDCLACMLAGSREPLADKQRVPNGYAGKFSIPYCIAAGLILGDAGFDAFTDERAADPRLRAVAAKVRYRIDPNDPYPRRFTGHIRATLADGQVVELRQPHFRGGASEPLTREEIETKCVSNARYGGWPEDRARSILDFSRSAFAAKRIDLTPFRG